MTLRARTTGRLAGVLAALALAGGLGLGAGGCGGGDGGGSSTGATAATPTTPGGTTPGGTAPGQTAPGRTAPGGSGGGDVDPAAVAVIRDWADTLRRGDVREAARRFALPTAVANGTRPLTLTTRAQVEAFNRSLPCGAVLLETAAGGRGLIVATFRLTERPGPGSCGSGTGRTAQAAFVVEDGLITHWLRVQDLPDAPGTRS
ncbi:hypothetical protein [Conexibacter woesei]|uniref:SnoaL-like domain-containing protein n=1 Tax=Conexibacter woesei (strain DSM 14684 / CCUG 47730 / CIP 108061 / JCM 11494 / NBRC 100937 / ID131577) TaxID=469383 RepID=D3F3D4_CONWI|nr:hypothetical protein [Conexibacter woesei]ADB50414.1 hypothetical protein Cwoe_1988 [Conexibacter woesei DSM 14684]